MAVHVSVSALTGLKTPTSAVAVSKNMSIQTRGFLVDDIPGTPNNTMVC